MTDGARLAGAGAGGRPELGASCGRHGAGVNVEAGLSRALDLLVLVLVLVSVAGR